MLSVIYSDVPMIDYNRQLVIYLSNCDYRLQKSCVAEHE